MWVRQRERRVCTYITKLIYICTCKYTNISDCNRMVKDKKHSCLIAKSDRMCYCGGVIDNLFIHQFRALLNIYVLFFSIMLHFISAPCIFSYRELGHQFKYLFPNSAAFGI